MMFLMMMNMFFLNSNNPLIMMLILIIQTLLISIMLGKMNLSFWMSFIIFLIFIGGMLILFMYMISLLNNYKTINLNKSIYIFFLIIILTMMFFNLNYNNNNEMLIFNKLIHFNTENLLNILKLYNMPNLIINLMLVIYLFLMMIISSKITNYYMGPFYKF
uniref:NADH-ubiquinone oxidoreductase chain 6 n=1 Tax=Mayetiola destructor TaxID=39758 RepID=C7FIK1_MAYDE|nr:NADH dehydrogenase subunit 6 [Mayetiola destructor]